MKLNRYAHLHVYMAGTRDLQYLQRRRWTWATVVFSGELNTHVQYLSIQQYFGYFCDLSSGKWKSGMFQQKCVMGGCTCARKRPFQFFPGK